MSDTIRRAVLAVPSIPAVPAAPAVPSVFAIRRVVPVVFAVLLMTFAAVVLSSCNVTRTITTESRYIHRNDTSVVIQSKTIETYDASKKL